MTSPKTLTGAESSHRLPVATSAQTWRLLGRELRRRPVATVSTLLVGLVAAAASVLPVYALGILVDEIRAGAPSSVIVPIGLVIMVSAVVAGLSTGLSTYLISRLGEHLLAGLRERTMSQALGLPTPVLERAGIGDLLARVGADVAVVGKVISEALPTLISSVLLGVLSVAAMAGIDWRLGLAGLIALPFYLLALRWYLPRTAPEYARQRVAEGDRSQHLVESLLGRATVHAYGLESRRLRGINASSAQVRDLSVSVFALFTRFVGRINRAEFIGLATIVVVGFVLVREGSVQVGQAAAAAVLFHRLFNPISMLLFSFDEIQEAGAALARIVGVLTIPAEDPPRGRAPADASLDLEGVRFSYDGRRDVLTGIDLRLEPGERLALVGSTGAGKSTLAAVIAGLAAPTSGTARIGGVAPTDLDRGHVTIVSQETHVFAGPVIEDLRLGRPDATEDEARAALATVGALDWVQALPEGLHTHVGAGGQDLTAAQAQHLALARLVLADPVVAVLDEATAEAGSLGARDLEAAAAAATAGRTTVIVAHRLTQAATADRVVVMEQGRIVEQGTHTGLLDAGGRYTRLWQAWRAGALPG